MNAMKIVLIGTGKMGSAIEKLALINGHDIVLKINENNFKDFQSECFKSADVAIEFTRPDAVVENLRLCLDAKIPVVCGTTGWHQHYNEVKIAFENSEGCLLHASNFSVGVNLMFELNRQLASWMKNHSQYLPHITEIHHTHKIDKPSGTAVTLANDIIQNNPAYKYWHLDNDPSQHSNSIPVNALREDEVIGDHTVEWKSRIDRIQIQHEAFSRDGFAEGALMAAKWIIGRKGVFSMNDILFSNG
jgi:4-hydroxy-tetrahydrodipicolinate reductase